jgi:hypothetical protein
MRCGGFFFDRCKGQRSQGVIDWELDEIKTGRKKAAKHCCQRLFVLTELLQLDFFVFHVLASFRIKFHDQHFVGRGFLVFGGRVKVTGAGS